MKVLDHGYVRFIEAWGHGDGGAPPTYRYGESFPDDTDMECGIIEAARQSTQGAFRGWDKDERLLKFLHDHHHDTPFEFAGMVVEVQAPIFVFREWHRHRTQSYNELSARYSPVPDVNYMPTVERCLVVNEKNKQAGSVVGADEASPFSAAMWLEKLDNLYAHCELVYQEGLDRGIPKEVARVCLPVGRYSRMRASANLRNWLGFMTLRDHPDAQHEIRLYAQAIGELLKKHFPRTWGLFEDSRKI